MITRLSQLPRIKAALLGCGGAVLLLTAGSAWADPLDEITGLEELKHARVVDMEAEWEDWYQLRVKWRAALREFQLQRARNGRLGKGQRRLRRRNRAATAARKGKSASKQRTRSSRKAARSTRPEPAASPGPDAFLAPTMQRQDARKQQKARKRRKPAPPPEPDHGVEVQ